MEMKVTLWKWINFNAKYENYWLLMLHVRGVMLTVISVCLMGIYGEFWERNFIREENSEKRFSFVILLGMKLTRHFQFHFHSIVQSILTYFNRHVAVARSRECLTTLKSCRFIYSIYLSQKELIPKSWRCYEKNLVGNIFFLNLSGCGILEKFSVTSFSNFPCPFSFFESRGIEDSTVWNL